MRRAFFLAALGFTLGFAPKILAQSNVTIGNQTPQSYDDVKFVIEEVIPDFLKENVQCGGWNLHDTVEGKIATVSGVPGRKTVWNGAILSGMGIREDSDKNNNNNDDFAYPDSAAGLMTLCEPGTSSIKKKIWVFTGNPDRDHEVIQVEVTYPYPKFEDPACRWRLQTGDNAFSEEAPSIPLTPIAEGADPPNFGQLSEEPKDRQSPETCEGLCSYLNTWMYVTCEAVVDELDPITGEPYKACPDNAITGNSGMVPHYLCTDVPVGDYTDPALCQPGADPPELGNAIGCSGKDCQIPFSYYRRYSASYNRLPVNGGGDGGDDTGNDVNANAADIACYGFYNQFDPQHHQTTPPDRRCVINIDVSEYRKRQQIKGEYGQNSSLPDRDPNDELNQRNGGAFNEDQDLWYQKLSGGFSLLNEKVFSGKFGNNLTNVLLNVDQLDKASMHATEQLTKDKPLAVSSTIRAFDDTGTGRVVVTWWQHQQNAMAQILHPPVVRMILPAGWSFGLDPDDPFLSSQMVAVKDPLDTRGERIELQINAEEDVLGTALGYIERSLLLQVEEEPVPVLLPLGSPTEYRALAEQWCMWYIRSFNQPTCNDAPADIKELMERLERYADDIENARLLRGELARYAGTVMTLQQEIIKPISQWVKQNIDHYQTVLQEQRAIRLQFASQWRGIQEQFNKFHDEANMPWCMNQRYTSPVYSLLDNWLPSRDDNGKMTGDGLPFLPAPAPEDIIVDLSTIARIPGTIRLPVLKPLQIRITNLPHTPASGTEYSIAHQPPDLPPINAIRDAIRSAADSLPDPPQNVEIPPPIEMHPLGSQMVNDIYNALSATNGILQQMTSRYLAFWKGIGPIFPEGPAPPDGERDNSIKTMKEHLECYDWDSDTCQHVEMDLMERLTRIGSRPLVFLPEDYQSLSPARGVGGVCIDTDQVCTPVHPESKEADQQWNIFVPSPEEDGIGALKQTIRDATLPAPVGSQNASELPSYVKDPADLLPVYDVPGPIDVTPPVSSSSQSSS